MVKKGQLRYPDGEAMAAADRFRSWPRKALTWDGFSARTSALIVTASETTPIDRLIIEADVKDLDFCAC
jgi:hypothetical protein